MYGGWAVVDLFASRENVQCALFYSLLGTDAPLGVDVLVYAWPRVLLYAFPPLTLIPPTLARMREYGHDLILAEIFRLMCAHPLCRDLLLQGRGSVFRPHLERLALWAWPLSGLACQLWGSHHK